MRIAYSVVIPAHNAEKFIGAALESVIRQTVKPAEIVVVDDGSSDATATLAASAGARVVSQPTSSGPSASRNRGVAATASPVVAFLDADDEWTPTHAERLLTALSSEGAAFAGSDAERFGAETGLVPSGLAADDDVIDLRDILITDNPVIQSSVMISRDAFEQSGGYDETLRLSEDYDLWTRVADRGKFAHVSAPTVRRRMHPQQASQRFRADMVRAWWVVRRRAVTRRLAAANARERDHVLGLLDAATESDLSWAIWTGDVAMLTIVREELKATDEALHLKDRLSSLGGFSSPPRRLSQDLRCASRAIYQAFIGQR